MERDYGLRFTLLSIPPGLSPSLFLLSFIYPLVYRYLFGRYVIQATLISPVLMGILAVAGAIYESISSRLEGIACARDLGLKNFQIIVDRRV